MIITIALVVLVFGLLVFVHELGHFLVARRNGIEVEEFGFGFPPRVFGVRRGQTLYSLNLIPLGGFVRLKGESGQPEKGSLEAASTWVKTKVLLAGVVANLLAAYLLVLVMAGFGLPRAITGELDIRTPGTAGPNHVMVLAVGSDSPASTAGIAPGQIITSIGGQSVQTAEELVEAAERHAGQEVTVELGLGERQRAVEVTLRDEEAGRQGGYLGVTPVTNSQMTYGWLAPVAAAELTAKMLAATLAGFAALISGLITQGQVTAGVVGPVGVVGIFGQVTAFGLSYVLFLVASISMSLAVINALPIPALDGGRLALVWTRHLSGGRLSASAEAKVHAVGMILLLMLMVIITIFDVRRIGS